MFRSRKEGSLRFNGVEEDPKVLLSSAFTWHGGPVASTPMVGKAGNFIVYRV